MLLKKIDKHSLITRRRLGQKKELANMAVFNNTTLNLFLDAFTSTKQNKFSNDDVSVFIRCEAYRQTLLKDTREISYEIFGLSETAIVSDICKKAASKPKWCQLLYSIAKALESPNIFEIGTNLGISGTYLLEAIKDKNTFFTTMEGLPQLCEIAEKQFSSIASVKKFQVAQGLYENTFPKIIQQNRNYNLMFVDGNHKKEPTLAYFDTLKTKMSTPAIFIFDDIYWSDEMVEAWESIKSDTEVNFTIDLYEQGIVILDKNESIRNKHFSLHLSY